MFNLNNYYPQAGETRWQKAERLIDIVLRGSKFTYHTFIRSLNEDEQGHLANEIIQCEGQYYHYYQLFLKSLCKVCFTMTPLHKNGYCYTVGFIHG